MKNKYLITVVIMMQSILMFSQENAKSWYVKAGGSYSSFQDVRYSNVHFDGSGAKLELGFDKETEKVLWGVKLQNTFSSEEPSTYNNSTVNVSSTLLEVKYLRKIAENIQVGTTWSIFDFYNRDVSGLGNNGRNELSKSSFFASTIYKYKKFKFGLDLGLFSFVKSSTSFAFSAPQGVLEEGNFNLQDDEILSRFSFNGYKLRALTENLQLRTSINYDLSKRFSVGYNWQFSKLTEVKKYPVSYGIHSLSLRYNFIKRTSNK